MTTLNSDTRYTTDWSKLTEIRCMLHNTLTDGSVKGIEIKNFFKKAMMENIFSELKLSSIEQSPEDKSKFICKIDTGTLQDGDYNISVRSLETSIYVDILNAVTENLIYALRLYNKCYCHIGDTDMPHILNTIDSIEHKSALATLYDVVIYNDFFTVSI